MDSAKKKQLLFDYKNRKTEMGIVSFRCIPTGESFLGPAMDTKSFLNRIKFQLELSSLPNLYFQDLWNSKGESAFEISVLEVLPYEEKEPDKDYSDGLKELYERCLQKTEHARSIK